MGLASTVFREMYLTAYRYELQRKIQSITEAKLALTSSVTNLVALGSDMDPESTEAKQLSARKAKLELMEQKLDMQLKQYNTQMEAVDTELKSVESVKKDEIQRSFSYGQN